MTEEQKEKAGFYSDDALTVAWNYWKSHSTYPKRIAFKDGVLYAFCASDELKLEWWDIKDKSHFPEEMGIDDSEFHKEYILSTLEALQDASSRNASAEKLEELSNHKNTEVRTAVANNPNTSAKILEKLSDDENEEVKESVGVNRNTPIETLEKLSNDKEVAVREGVANNRNTPEEILEKLSNEEIDSVRMTVANNPNTPVEILKKLSDDENGFVAGAASETLKEVKKI